MYVFKLVTPSERTDDKTEVTRWVYKGELTDKTWDALNERLKQLFGKRTSLFVVSWFDGSDYCTVRDFEDLVAAVDYFEEANEKAVRLYVSPDKREHHTIFGENPDVEPVPVSESRESDPDESDDSVVVEPLPPPPPPVAAVATARVPEPAAPKDEPTSEPAPAPVAMPPFPMGPYFPYGMQYPYGQFYPTVQPNTMYPMMQPSTATVPSEPVPNPGGDTVPSAPPLFGVPPVLPAPAAPAPQKSGPDTEMLKAIRQLSATATVKPGTSAPGVVPRENKSRKTNPVSVAMGTLRSMGYQQDERELKKVIKLHKGNLNAIIDQLEKTNL